MQPETKDQVIERLVSDPNLLTMIRDQTLNVGAFCEFEILNALAKLRPEVSTVLFVYYWNQDDSL